MPHRPRFSGIGRLNGAVMVQPVPVGAWNGPSVPSVGPTSAGPHMGGITGPATQGPTPSTHQMKVSCAALLTFRLNDALPRLGLPPSTWIIVHAGHEPLLQPVPAG